MQKNILKVFFLSANLLISSLCSAATAAEAIKEVGGKKYYVHKVEANETIYRLTVNYKVSQAELTAANPKLKNGLQKDMEVLIPVKSGVKPTTTTAAKDKPASTASASTKPTVKTVTHTVEKGETMFSIAKKYNTTVEDIKKRNADKLKAGLKSGSKLTIAQNSAGNTPAIKAAAQAEKQSSSTSTATASNQSGMTVHEVKKGETLYSISKDYHVNVKDVERLNPDVKKSGVKAGKALIMPSTSRYIAQKNSKAEYRVHKVQKHETIFSISQKYRVSTTELIQKNGLKSGVKAGQYIALPPEKKTTAKAKTVASNKQTATAPKKSANIAHTVKKGETMFSICKTYKISESALVKSNPELKKGLKEGRIVFIPRAEAKNTTWACSNGATVGKNIVNVAIVLPFESKDGKIDRNTDKFIEFYEGALLAVDKLKKDGTSVHVYTYNSGKTDEDIKEILRNTEMLSMDMIIGPAYKAQFKAVSDFARENDIKVIVPFSTRTEEMKSNPNMYLVNPPHAQAANIISHKIANRFKDKNIVIVKFANQEFNDEEELGDTLAHLLQRNNIAYKSIVFNNTDKLMETVNENGENIFVPVTTNQMALGDFLPSVNAIAMKNNVELFGFQDWNKYQSISKDLYAVNTYFASPFDINFDQWTPRYFIKQYRQYFDEEPGNTVPMYGAIGYDIMIYFGKAIALYGKNFSDQLSNINVTTIQSKFDFKRINSEGGYYNAHITLSANNKEDGHKAIDE